MDPVNRAGMTVDEIWATLRDAQQAARTAASNARRAMTAARVAGEAARASVSACRLAIIGREEARAQLRLLAEEEEEEEEEDPDPAVLLQALEDEARAIDTGLASGAEAAVALDNEIELASTTAAALAFDRGICVSMKRQHEANERRVRRRF